MTINIDGAETATGQDKTMPVAIVGMACRYPEDATSPAAFFDMLANGRSAWSEVPETRYNIDAYWHPSKDRIGTTTARGAHWMKEDPALFDAPFFSITATEAAALDPQLRMLLEVTFECLDNAGMPMESLAGSNTSVYVASSSQEYPHMMMDDGDNIPLYAAVGSGTAMLANRISHFYDLRGPSIALDTACSGGLVAAHLGCQSLRSGESRMSLVAASQLILRPDSSVSLSRLQFLSPSSRCYTFDDRANGYARGEGICVLALKSLDDALRDSDTIRAVIRATGTNQDGKTPGIVQPNSEAQAALIRQTYETAGFNYSNTQYFEAHGTGTPVGDPLELGALATAFATRKRDSKHPLYVGSVKTNIGHLEGGAGLAGLMKTVLSLENGVIVPSLNFENPNPKLLLEDWHLQVPTKLMPWPTHGLRRASVNSFGYGGSNAHMIIDDAYHYLKLRGIDGNVANIQRLALHAGLGSDEDPGVGAMPSSLGNEPQNSYERPRLFVFSSPEQAALQRLAVRYIDHLHDTFSMSLSGADDFLNNLAFTLGNRRSVFRWRTALVATSVDDLTSTLRQSTKSKPAGKSPGIVYVFTGQGAQWHAMGRELLHYKVFAQTVTKANEYLASLGADWDIESELNASKEKSRINLPKISQPLCTILQVALVNLLGYWGVNPIAVVGHSSGEIAAAYAAGALSANDCFRIAYHRGRLSNDIRRIVPELRGSMISVGLSEDEVQPYLKKLDSYETAVIACVNSPSNVSLSGEGSALDKLEEQFKLDGVFARRLKVEVAYHSPYMRVIADEYLASIKDIETLSNNAAPIMFSSVTGNVVDLSELCAPYWVRNLVSPVQFSNAVGAIFPAVSGSARNRQGNRLSANTVLEIGPHGALQGPLRQILTKNGRSGDVDYVSVLLRGKDAIASSLEALGKLWTKGQSVHLLRVNSLEVDDQPLQSLTNLPNYPWNHTKKYWHESARTINCRFRKTPRLDLLGSPVQDFNPLEPRWRNITRLAEIPWLSDYKIQGSILLSAASMLCAVLEAAQQLAETTEMIQGFEFRDILIHRALVIPSGEGGISTALHVKPRKAGTRAKESFWYEFTFYSEPKDQRVIEHCSGLLQIQYKTIEKEVDAEAIAESNVMKVEHAKYQLICKKCVNPRQFYETWRSHGLQWGPQFQVLTNIQSSNNAACVMVAVSDTRATMPAKFEYDHLLHPATLDACFQATFVPTEGDSEGRVLTSIESLYVSADLPKRPGAELCGFSTLIRNSFNGFVGSVVMSDKPWSLPKIVMKGARFTRLEFPGGNGAAEKMPSEIRKICSHIVWKEDLDQIHQNEASQLLYPKTPVSTEIAAACQKAAIIFMGRALDAPSSRGNAVTARHLTQYKQWIQERLKSIDRHDYAGDTEGDFLSNVSQSSIDGRLLCKLGEKLQGILDGSIDAQSVLGQDNMLSEYYSNSLSIGACNSMVAKWVELSGHKRPGQRILEVGAGVTSLSLQAVEALGGQYGTSLCCIQYVFTNSDKRYFGSAQKLLSPWEDRVEYKELDIETDLAEQGFEEGSFDVILASHVLHATKRIDIALSHCFQLLKPGGKLVLGEYTHPLDHLHLIMGALPTWWWAEDERTNGPLLDENEWNRRLTASKFSGIDIVTRDTQDDDNHCSSMIVTTKPITPTLSFTNVVLIQAENASRAVQTFSNNLFKKLTNLGLDVDVSTLDQAAAIAHGKLHVSGKPVVSLLEAESPFVSDLSEMDFVLLKRVLIGCQGGLWISRSNRQLDPAGDPAFCSTIGLLRSIRNEKPDIRMHELALSSQIQITSSDAAGLVGNSVKSILEADSKGLEAETETGELNGLLYVPRIFDHKTLNKTLSMIGKEPPTDLQPLFQPNRPLRLEIGTPGMLNTLRFVHDPVPLEALGDNDVELEVHANGMNFDDILVSMGLVADTKLGVDAAGIVKRVGSKVTLVKPGDLVVTFCLGAYRSILRTHESLVAELPEGMSLQEGASLPCVYVTAYQALYVAGRLSPGETILIHSAAGGLGQAAIQLAKHIGAEIFVTAGSSVKRQLLMDEYQIPPDHVFNSRDLSFAKGIMRMTAGRGVDVVLNSLSGEALRRTWECISTFGRFVEVGKRDILGNTGLDMSPFLRNVTFAGVNMEYMLRHDRTMMARVLRKTFDLIRKGSVGLIKPTTVYRYSDMEKAFRTMQQANHMGKIVFRAYSDDMVPIMLRNPYPISLNKNATYVIVGGLGGIGRSLAVLLAQHGAKHLAFISRSGAVKPEAKATVDELKSLGVNSTSYICDVADTGTFESTMSRMTAEKPPVKGAIHSAMILNDALFEDMTYDQWSVTTRVKIQGAWNMHKFMPKALDFFIMLSSASGYMGASTLSNYVSGNTFLDGLAQYRRAQGLAACSLGLGFVAGIGWAEENVKVSDDYRADYDLMSIQAPEVYSLIKSTITGYIDNDTPMPAIIATCLGSGGELQQTKLIKTRYYYADPKFAYIRQLDTREGALQGSVQNAVVELTNALLAATSRGQAAKVIEGALASKLAMSMSVSTEDIDTSRPVSVYGVDSLVSMEIRNWVFTVLKSNIGRFDILQAGPMTVLAAKIAENSTLVPEEVRKEAIV